MIMTAGAFLLDSVQSTMVRMTLLLITVRAVRHVLSGNVAVIIIDNAKYGNNILVWKSSFSLKIKPAGERHDYRQNGADWLV